MIAATIATPSHVGPALLALESLQAHNPDITDTLLLLINGSASTRWSSATRVRVVTVDDLGDSERLARMRQYYSTFEYCNAVKPWLHQYLLGAAGAARWIYVDADTWTLAPIPAAMQLLDSCDLFATRHARLAGNAATDVARDLGLCQYGTVNGGLLGMRRSSTAAAFVEWWKQRLVLHGRECISEGEYVDQRWLDVAQMHFAPAFCTERLAGINIGHWNLHELNVAGSALSERDGTPVRLAHLSLVHQTKGRAEMDHFPAVDPARRAAFTTLAGAWASAVQQCADRIAGMIVASPAPRAFDAADRAMLIDALRAGKDEAGDFARAIAQLPRPGRTRALRKLGLGLGALRRLW